MAQRDQVIEVMQQNGGLCTLVGLYQQVDTSSWETKNPDARIHEIVQEDEWFFKIKPELWGLNSHREELNLAQIRYLAKKIEEREHSHYRGLLLQIGNLKNFQTFVLDQDRNKVFQHTTLGETRNLQKIHHFCDANIMKRVCMIDVIWFNERNMPHAVFEVEHSTDFTNTLSKYIALQDFNIKFCVVSSKSREGEFKERILLDEYHSIHKRVAFMDYDELANWHRQSMATGQLLRIVNLQD